METRDESLIADTFELHDLEVVQAEQH